MWNKIEFTEAQIKEMVDRASLIGTEMFCNKIATILQEKFKIHCSISYCHNKKDSTTRSLRISGRRQVKKFLDWIYSECDICLARKKQIYLDNYCSE